MRNWRPAARGWQTPGGWPRRPRVPTQSSTKPMVRPRWTRSAGPAAHCGMPRRSTAPFRQCPIVWSRWPPKSSMPRTRCPATPRRWKPGPTSSREGRGGGEASPPPEGRTGGGGGGGGGAAGEGLQWSDARVAEVTAELAALEQDLAARCTALTELRREAAGRLEVDVRRTLAALEMQRTRLTVAFDTAPDADGLAVDGRPVAVRSSGVDRVEFLFAPNPGEAPRPLAKIASGGELSRVMLALRHVLATTSDVPVMVCDEV